MSQISADKKKSLDSVIANINKKFGAGTISRVSDIFEQLRIKFWETPSLEFNVMLGGGLGKGRIIELYGESGSGKTSIAMETIAHNQKLDPNFTAGWFETEGSFDPDYAEKVFGIDMSRCIYWDQSDTGAEQGFDILRSLVSSGQFNMIVVNSVAGLAPKKEIEDDIEKANIALTARMMSKLMRVITGAASKTNTTLVFINQIRTNVGVMFGNPETTTGGKALAFYASQRVAMRRTKPEKSDGYTEEEAMKVVSRTVKNRMAKGNPYKKSEYIAVYGKGIDVVSEIPTIVEREGIVEKTGAWYRYTDEQGKEYKWNGRAAFLKELNDNPDLTNMFKGLINNTLAQGSVKGSTLDKEEIDEINKIEKDLEIEMEEVESEE